MRASEPASGTSAIASGGKSLDAALATSLIRPDWPAPSHVAALMSTRAGGASVGPYGTVAGTGGLNLGLHVGDDPVTVALNRAALTAAAGATPVWLEQVHGTVVHDCDAPRPAGGMPPVADAAITSRPGIACTVMVADCLPVLLTDRAGSVVGIAHAGWRGLADGVIEATLAAMAVPPATIMAWLGPSIGPRQFEVGDEVRAVFVATDPRAVDCFVPARPGKWLADLPALARQRLGQAGVMQIAGGTWCTVSDPARFYSYRRDRVCGRMAAMIWLAAPR